ncbi:hypothetical protein VNI00_004142 [Paramarasmius palmivorus]|uniref:Cytochrome P450 n=1 Tax=Paramarasmius palmivorus TaxID=297713 RepID=A0AAW0DKZ1_9AGAR
MGVVAHSLAAVFLLLTAIAVYRFALHPLRRFPGPKLAAVTDYYQAYFDIVKGGELLNHLRDLHVKYGPVVRIGPNTLHFADADAYHDIYTHGQSFTKYKTLYSAGGQADSSVSFVDPQKARSRRTILNPLFSRRAILKLEPVIQERVDKLIHRLSAWPKNETVNMSFAFKCISLDVISEYCFANCFNALDTSDFRHPSLCAIQELLPNLWKQKHFPILLKVVDLLPESLVLWINPGIRPLLDIKRTLATQVDRLLADNEALKAVEHATIYHHMFDPGAEKHDSTHRHVRPTRKSLVDEALTLIGAGSDTVGVTSTVGTFYALHNPEIARKLKDELLSVWPDPEGSMSLSVLEKLPYLTAFIKESLRLGHGVVSPLPRVIGSDATIGRWAIPAGTVVEMSGVLLHEDPDVFQDPQTFSPERWLQPATRNLDFNLVPFSRGPRICLGLKYAIFGSLLRPC